MGIKGPLLKRLIVTLPDHGFIALLTRKSNIQYYYDVETPVHLFQSGFVIIWPGSHQGLSPPHHHHHHHHHPLPCVLCRDDLGFRWVSEQVSHHPPVSAFHAEGLKEDFLFHGSIYPKLKFWGKSVEERSPRGSSPWSCPSELLAATHN